MGWGEMVFRGDLAPKGRGGIHVEKPAGGIGPLRNFLEGVFGAEALQGI